MKGMTLLSDIFLLLMLIGLIIIMSSLVWAIILIHGVMGQLGLSSPRNVEFTVLLNPIRYDTTLLAFLESNYQGIPVKEIINAAVIQKKTIDIWVEGKFIDMQTVSNDFFSKALDANKDGTIDSPYLLKIRDPEMILGQYGSLTSNLQRVSTKVFLLDGKSVDLYLYVSA
jgi:hypothetical protein